MVLYLLGRGLVVRVCKFKKFEFLGGPFCPPSKFVHVPFGSSVYQTFLILLIYKKIYVHVILGGLPILPYLIFLALTLIFASLMVKTLPVVF